MYLSRPATSAILTPETRDRRSARASAVRHRLWEGAVLVLLTAVGVLVVAGMYAFVGIDALREKLRENRAIAALAVPQNPWVGVDETSLSLAVLAFVYGRDGLPLEGNPPGSHADVVRERFGVRSGPLLDLIGHCLRAACWYAAGGAPQAEVARRMRVLELTPGGAMRLSPDAADALAAWAATHDGPAPRPR
jgi:hypothetical protein